MLVCSPGNHFLSQHHGARPEERPMPNEKSKQKDRMIPAFMVRNFNILTNRYCDNHGGKAKRDSELNLLEATAKRRKEGEGGMQSFFVVK